MIQVESRITVCDNSGAKEALRLAAQNLPITTKFVVRRDYDIQNQNA